MPPKWCIIIACILLPLLSFPQQSDKLEQAAQFPLGFFNKVNEKLSKLDAQLQRQSIKYLQRLQQKERKLQRRLRKIDSVAAKQLAANSSATYGKLISKIKSSPSLAGELQGEYLPYVDSLHGVLSFLDNNPLQLPENLQANSSKIFQQFQQFQGRLNSAAEVKSFIGERKRQLREIVGQHTKFSKMLSGELNSFNKEVYYYSRQLKEYKEILNNPDKLTTKALSLLNKLPAFRDFIRENSQLSGLFGMAGDAGDAASLAGLQTRSQVQAIIQSQVSTAGQGGSQMLQQSLQSAQAQLNQFKNKLDQLGNHSGDLEMPDFKPNNQRTKSFLKRIEVGTNLQSTRSNSFFPTTTDLGLSLGYKITNNTIMGFGGSYKVGWGKDIKNIVVTGEGAAIRSFVDVKLKGSFFLSGGFEYNYQVAHTVGITTDLAWTKSGLVGISKVISLKTKFFKKTKVQLLWDFLSYREVPRTQALKFRVGYFF